MVNLPVPTSMRINVVNGVVASVAISQHRCCANVPRLLARPLPLPLLESSNRLIWFRCRQLVCTVCLFNVVYLLCSIAPSESMNQIEAVANEKI